MRTDVFPPGLFHVRVAWFPWDGVDSGIRTPLRSVAFPVYRGLYREDGVGKGWCGRIDSVFQRL
ncbi:MAG: hypothetical protein Q4C47_03455 [Planctomycetia bacterium]|nr:hypothetical protein [Planctomycetia bacterium]